MRNHIFYLFSFIFIVAYAQEKGLSLIGHHESGGFPTI